MFSPINTFLLPWFESTSTSLKSHHSSLTMKYWKVFRTKSNNLSSEYPSEQSLNLQWNCSKQYCSSLRTSHHKWKQWGYYKHTSTNDLFIKLRIRCINLICFWDSATHRNGNQFKWKQLTYWPYFPLNGWLWLVSLGLA